MHKFSMNESRDYVEEGRPWYDTYKGVKESLKSLDTLTSLVHERQVAGYERDERLNQFWILGRYHLDTRGNCGKISPGFVPKEEYPEIPDVLTYDEFWSYIRDKNKTDEDPIISWNLESNLPFPGVPCAYCNDGWDVTNCHDTVARHEWVTFLLQEFVGKTLGAVKTAYTSKTDAVYRMQSDILIRNDRFIDLSPKYPDAEKEWQKGLLANEMGWVSERDGITDDYVIQEEDEGRFSVWKYYHSICNREDLKIFEEQRFREVFTQAGFKINYMDAISNQYCPCDGCAPWFVVETEFGPITIGWRKRVISIDWSEIIQTDAHAREITAQFEGENVTKGSTSIHAWGWDKAKEYLSRIRQTLAP